MIGRHNHTSHPSHGRKRGATSRLLDQSAPIRKCTRAKDAALCPGPELAVTLPLVPSIATLTQTTKVSSSGTMSERGRFNKVAGPGNSCWHLPRSDTTPGFCTPRSGLPAPILFLCGHLVKTAKSRSGRIPHQISHLENPLLLHFALAHHRKGRSLLLIAERAHMLLGKSL